jgi:hypothetical protein
MIIPKSLNQKICLGISSDYKRFPSQFHYASVNLCFNIFLLIRKYTTGITTNENSVEAIMPKMKLQANPEKMGSSTIIIEPRTAEAAVKKIGFRRVAPASMMASAKLISGLFR